MTKMEKTDMLIPKKRPAPPTQVSDASLDELSNNKGDDDDE
jgi:hypothetical protein